MNAHDAIEPRDEPRARIEAHDVVEARARRDDHHAQTRALVGSTLSHGGHS
jgi:hypothetical protein